jgi:hypothetical protein
MRPRLRKSSIARRESRHRRRADLAGSLWSDPQNAPVDSGLDRPLLLPILKTDRITVTVGGSCFYQIPTSVENVDAILEDVRKLPASKVRDCCH